MPVKRTTIELDEELVKAAQQVTGQTVRATVEEGLRSLIATAEREREAKRSRVSAHLDIAHSAVDVEVLQADELFELAAVTDPAVVPDAVAAVLGITQQPGKTVSESVAARWRAGTLLVLDKSAHVLAAADGSKRSRASATIRILATSREGLGVRDERIRPVRSLDATTGVDSAAVSLFVERAQGIAPGFSMVDDDEAAAVTEICQRLDGIPLDIDLAASDGVDDRQ